MTMWCINAAHWKSGVSQDSVGSSDERVSQSVCLNFISGSKFLGLAGSDKTALSLTSVALAMDATSMASAMVVSTLELICLEKFHIIIGLIGFISGALSVTFLGRLPARRFAYVARRCGFMSKWCAQPDPPPFGDGMESIADHGADHSIEGLCLAPPYRGARRVHYSEESEPFRVDRLTPASDRMANRLLDLTVLPQVIYVSSGSLDTK